MVKTSRVDSCSYLMNSPGRHCGSHLVQELANLIIEVRGKSCCLLVTVAKWANGAVAEIASSAPGWLGSSVQERPALCA